MGPSNFVKDAEEKPWDAVTSQHDKNDQAKRMQEHLDETDMPDTDKVNIQITDGKVTVTGNSLNQEVEKKILVAVGNIFGIASVDDQVETATPATANQFHTIKSGDTLSAVSKQVYDNANLCSKIFEANKPMPRGPDKIYPGQVLCILEEQLIASHRLLDNGSWRQ